MTEQQELYIHLVRETQSVKEAARRANRTPKAIRMGIQAAGLTVEGVKAMGPPEGKIVLPSAAPTATTAESKSRVQQLEAQLEAQQQIIEQLRAPRVKIAPRSSAPGAREDYLRVIVPDSHGCIIDPAAAGSFLTDLATLKPKHIVMLGDHVDCGGFLAQHHVMSYLAQVEYSFEEDVQAANTFLDQIQAAAPDALIEYLEGNHERRVEQWICTATLKNHKDAAFLARRFSIPEVLSIEKRGILLYRQGRHYDNCSIPATIKRGHCYFTHGSRTSKNAAAQTLSDFGACVVFGHTHRIDQATTRKVNSSLLSAWNPGCLCSLKPLYGHTNVHEWGHGYGLQFVRGDQDFLHVNVPIIDGVSYLEALIDRMKLAA